MSDNYIRGSKYLVHCKGCGDATSTKTTDADSIRNKGLCGLCADSRIDFEDDEQGRKDDSTKPKAVELLETSAATLIRCGKKYDSTGNNSERVMDRIVDMFNAATGHELSEAQGNIFMVCLKVVRSETSTYHDDDHYIDGVNYFAMAGEAASEATDD